LNIAFSVQTPIVVVVHITLVFMCGSIVLCFWLRIFSVPSVYQFCLPRRYAYCFKLLF